MLQQRYLSEDGCRLWYLHHWKKCCCYVRKDLHGKNGRDGDERATFLLVTCLEVNLGNDGKELLPNSRDESECDGSSHSSSVGSIQHGIVSD